MSYDDPDPKDKVVTAIIGLGFLAAALALMPSRAKAQEAHEGHAQFHDHYRHWVIPGTADVPCCNAKYDFEGRLLKDGDCYPTTAHVENGVWIVKLDTGVEVEVPENRIVREPNPDPTGEKAHVCESNATILCFRPPNLGF